LIDGGGGGYEVDSTRMMIADRGDV
jgi:hypothetical protein